MVRCAMSCRALLAASLMAAPLVCAPQSPSAQATHWIHVVAVLVPMQSSDGRQYDELQAGRTADGFDTEVECTTSKRTHPVGFLLQDGARVVLSDCVEARRPPAVQQPRHPDPRNKAGQPS